MINIPKNKVSPSTLFDRQQLAVPSGVPTGTSHPSVKQAVSEEDVKALLMQMGLRGHEIVKVYIPLLVQQGDRIAVEDHPGFAFENKGGLEVFMHRQDTGEFHEIDANKIPKGAVVDRFVSTKVEL